MCFLIPKTYGYMLTFWKKPREQANVNQFGYWNFVVGLEYQKDKIVEVLIFHVNRIEVCNKTCAKTQETKSNLINWNTSKDIKAL